MTIDQIKILGLQKIGVYEIQWIDLSWSVGAVGMNTEGKLWFAPANWSLVPCYDWSLVRQLIMIQSQDIMCEKPQTDSDNPIIIS